MVKELQIRWWLWRDHWTRVMPERFVMWVAWHLPRELVKWCAIRVFSNATSGQWGDTHPDEVNYSVAMTRWEER